MQTVPRHRSLLHGLCPRLHPSRPLRRWLPYRPTTSARRIGDIDLRLWQIIVHPSSGFRSRVGNRCSSIGISL